MKTIHWNTVNISIRLFCLSIIVGFLVDLLTVSSVFTQPIRAGTGEVISVREFPLKSNVDSGEFEKFIVRKFNPALEGAFPGVKAFVTKGDRGTGNDRYAYILIFDSQKTRDVMIPTK